VPSPQAQRILVVEDDKDDVFLIEYACTHACINAELSFAENGKHAIEQLLDQSRAPDLILLDLNMPVMNGVDFLRWLRSQAAWQRLPVIIFTTSEDPRDIALSYELGANAYLVKPNIPSELSRILQAVQQFWLRSTDPAESPNEHSAELT
jgi:CheY-like chemotaxis protein